MKLPTNFRKPLIIGGIWLASLVAAVLITQFTATPQVKTVTVEKIVEKIVLTMDEKSMSKEVDRRVKEIQTEIDKHKVKVTVRQPNGTVTTTTTTDTHATSNTTEVQIKYVDRVVERIVTQTVDRIVERKVIAEPILKNWRTGVLVGATPSLFPPNLQPWVVGLEVDRRLAGPFWVGLWGTTAFNTTPTPAFGGMTVGLKLMIEF